MPIDPSHIIEAVERIWTIVEQSSLPAFEKDWQKQWMMERGSEIISEASRHLTADMKNRHPGIPWRKVARIGNVLRHDYESVSKPILWAVALKHLPDLKRVCQTKLEAVRR